jgi:hypothetical protein
LTLTLRNCGALARRRGEDQMPRFRWFSTAAIAVLPALPLSASVTHPGPGPAAPRGQALHANLADQSWDLSVERHFGLPGNAGGFSTILQTAGQLWAFGGTNPGGTSTPVAARLSGHRWVASALPARLPDFISDASATGPADIWAISSYGRYVLHWDGASWQIARRWSEPGYFTDIVATSARDAWVFGTTANGSNSLGTWHFDGRAWLRSGGAARDIYRASAISSRDIWAIAAGTRSDAVLRFEGRRWHRVRDSGAISGVRWRDILAESARDVWLLGDTANGRLELAHWNGSSWRRFGTSLSALAGQLATGRNGRVLATATSFGRLPSGLILELTDTGHVTTSVVTSQLGCGVSDAVYVARTGSLWASGGTLTRLGGNAAIWVRTPPDGDRDRDDV